VARTWSNENCSIKRTLEVVGDKWTLLVLREAYLGERRFEQLLEGVGCARNILSDRLNTLVHGGLLRRESYREPGARQRYEYRLTQKGFELFPALVSLMQWGDRWLADAEGPSVAMTHRACGQPIRSSLCCEAGHLDLTARDTISAPGPGAVRTA
jgi:DNA-binding HxlR family transcriptional regulator